MPSTFECPYCKSRDNNWVSSVWNPETRIDLTTYQCKQCLNFFEIGWSTAEEEPEDEQVLEM